MEKKLLEFDEIIDGLIQLRTKLNKVIYDLHCFLDYLIEESGEKL